MTKAFAFGRAGLPRAGALRLKDAPERVIRRQVAAVDGVFSSENRMQGAQVFAERRDTGVEGR